jgi:hypothetical protein
MEIPERVRVGAYEIPVKLVEDLGNDRGCGGEYSPRKLEISLDLAFKVRIGEIFLHEVLECICSQYDLDIDHHHLMVLSNTLFQVLKDNKLQF